MPNWLTPDDPCWGAVLSRVSHDFYHWPCYAQLCARWECARAMAYHDIDADGSELLVPLLLRDTPGSSLRDASSPYGYPAPLATASPDAASASGLVARMLDFGREQGIVSTFLRLHPLLPDPLREAFVAHPAITLFNHAPTVSIDLTRPQAELDRATRENHRRDIRKLRRAGYAVRHDGAGDFAAFQTLYEESMKRVGAAAGYRFDARYFVELRDCLGTALHLCAVLTPAGEMACAGLFVRVGEFMQYHLGATATQYLQVAPSKLMFAAMRERARESGATTLHLGGGRGGAGDSLLYFKRGFASREHAFTTVRIVHDQDAFDRLNAEWLTRHGLEAFPDDEFFPPYRRPTPASVCRDGAQ